MTRIDIKGLDKAAVLAALYNASRVQGLGFLQARNGDMTAAQAAKIIKEAGTYFDYLHGKVMKVDLSGDDFFAGLYDRDNGAGAAERAIAHLRK